MLLNIGDDGRRKEAFAGVSFGEAGAEGSGGDVFVDVVEEMDADALGWRKGQALGVREGVPGTADDDPLGEGQGLPRFVPVAQSMEGVRAKEVEEIGGGELVAESVESIHGVVGAVAVEWCVEIRGDQVGVVGAEEADHRESVGEGGDGAAGLEWLKASGGEEDPVKREIHGGGSRDGEVAAVGGVEAAAEEGYAHFVGVGAS